MAGVEQSKRVSWAPDVKLCQVRLFLSEDTPSQCGCGAQDHLQAKTSWLQHSRELSSDESLPPGFEASFVSYQPIKGISQIPVIEWKAPLKLFLRRDWLVVAGEESEEVGLQNQRQLGVFEAIYPRLYSIPSNPASAEEQDSAHLDDARTPLVPITPIEDDLSDELDSQAALDTPTVAQHADVTVEVSTPSLFNLTKEGPLSSRASCAPDTCNSEGPAASSLVPGAVPDVMAAASAAFTALIKSSEEGSLIDRDLLIKILSNPSLIEKLGAESRAPGQRLPTASAAAIPPGPPLPSNWTASMPVPPVAQILAQPAQTNESNAVMRTTTNLQPSTTRVQVAATPAAGGPSPGPPSRDMSYFKNLIQRHGGEEQEGVDSIQVPFDSLHGHPLKPVAGSGNNIKRGIPQNPGHKDMRQRIQKPCMYFNSPRGCRRGADCLYMHDASLPRTFERQSRKKIKLDRETARRTR